MKQVRGPQMEIRRKVAMKFKRRQRKVAMVRRVNRKRRRKMKWSWCHQVCACASAVFWIDEFSWNKSLFNADPKEWDAANIKSWLTWMTKKFQLNPAPVLSRFPESGEALIKYSRADFWVCAGTKEGGNILAKYIAHLIHSSTGRSTSPLLNDNDPGNWK